MNQKKCRNQRQNNTKAFDRFIRFFTAEEIMSELEGSSVATF